MTKAIIITKSATKLATAAALAEAKRRRSWSNADAAEVLGTSEGTVRNRLAEDEPDKHHMTVHELARAIAAGEVPMVNQILTDLVGYHVAPNATSIELPDVLDTAQAAARAAAELIAAAADGEVDAAEADSALPRLVELQAELTGLIEQFRPLAAKAPRRRLEVAS